MSENWKDFDFQGGGLQSANLRLAQVLKRRRIAYGLVALFPLGLHRDYLEDRRGAWFYRIVAAAVVGCVLAGQPLLAAGLLAALAASALYDLVRIEDRLTRINKQLRMQVYMSQTEGAPPGYTGRLTDAPQQPQPGGGEPRSPSFAEQERLLRELAKQRKNRGE